MGQGIPLTDFYNSQGILVKDLHNSFVTIFVRNGFFGSFLFFSLILKMLLNLLHNINVLKNNKTQCNFYRTCLIFISSVMIFSIMQSGLEVSYIAIPFYLIFGIVGSYKLNPEKN